MMIKQATTADAPEIAAVITARIKACVQDHNNNNADIQAWLANKTEDNIKEWINNHLALVYTQDTQIVAVILAAHSGMILLNYTLPSKAWADSCSRML